MGFSNRTRERRLALITQIDNWKKGLANPPGEDGQPAPLRVLSIYAPGQGEPAQFWPCDAKTNHVDRAEEIMQFCEEHANEVSDGEAVVFTLVPHFGSGQSGRLKGGNWPIKITPMPSFEGPDRFASTADLSSPKMQNSALTKEAMALTRESWALVGGTMRITIESLERQVERLQAENQALKQERERTWELQQKMMDHQQDRDLKARRENIELTAWEAGAAKLIGYLPVLLQGVDRWVAEKAGMNGTSTEDANKYRDTLKDLLSRLGQKNKITEVIKLLELKDEEAMSLYNFGKEFLVEQKRSEMIEEANSAVQGLIPQMPLRALPRIAGKIS
jgi:hypothetical protein